VTRLSDNISYLTVNHGHAALFGTYGTLAIGLVLFALRGLGILWALLRVKKAASSQTAVPASKETATT